MLTHCLIDDAEPALDILLGQLLVPPPVLVVVELQVVLDGCQLLRLRLTSDGSFPDPANLIYRGCCKKLDRINNRYKWHYNIKYSSFLKQS